VGYVPLSPDEETALLADFTEEEKAGLCAGRLPRFVWMASLISVSTVLRLRQRARRREEGREDRRLERLRQDRLCAALRRGSEVLPEPIVGASAEQPPLAMIPANPACRRVL
jgi:hypothetical protein